MNLQQVANLSGEGKISTAKVQALMQKKQVEAQAKSKALADAQAKLQSSGAILSDAARAQLEKDIERMNVEGQRFQQDAQAEINELSQQLQGEFQQKLFPVLEAVSKEKGVQVLLSAADAGVVWAEAGLDLTHGYRQEARRHGRGRQDGSAGCSAACRGRPETGGASRAQAVGGNAPA